MISWQRRLSNIRECLLEDRANKGLGGPPNNWRRFVFGTEEVDEAGTNYERWSLSIGFGDDGGEIWLSDKSRLCGKGHDQSLYFDCRAEHFRKMALWYLWRWAWGEWFGLRRWLYYKDPQHHQGHGAVR